LVFNKSLLKACILKAFGNLLRTSVCGHPMTQQSPLLGW
jgi:hypothetical protein